MSPCMQTAIEHLIAGALRFRLVETMESRGQDRKQDHGACKAADARGGSLKDMPGWSPEASMS